MRDDSRSAARTQLLQAILLYVGACVREPNRRPTPALPLRVDQAQRLARLTTTDLVRFGELVSRCVRVDIDAQALDDVLSQVETRRRRDELIERCIRAHAPREMMQAFFGLSRHRYARLRELLAIPNGRGRARRPTETLEQRIHEAWITSDRSWSAQRLLHIAEQLGASLRVVWAELKHRRSHPTSR